MLQWTENLVIFTLSEMIKDIFFSLIDVKEELADNEKLYQKRVVFCQGEILLFLWYKSYFMLSEKKELKEIVFVKYIVYFSKVLRKWIYKWHEQKKATKKLHKDIFSSRYFDDDSFKFCLHVL